LGALSQAAEQAGSAAETALAVSHYQAAVDADEVDLALIEALLMYICGEGPYKREEDPDAAPGAVLVFLPGALRGAYALLLGVPTVKAAIVLFQCRVSRSAILPRAGRPGSEACGYHVQAGTRSSG
jgi:hypothetical protein